MTWYENLPKEEVPPEHLWEDSEGLEQWWQRIEEKRSEGDDTKGEAISIPGSTPGDEDAPSGTARNDLARALK